MTYELRTYTAAEGKLTRHPVRIEQQSDIHMRGVYCNGE